MGEPLSAQLDRVSEPARRTLAAHGFDVPALTELARRLTGVAPQASNAVRGMVEAPRAGDLDELPESTGVAWRDLEAVGLDALRRGECAMVLLAGGMATRMGGVVKALVDALPGKRFLDLRLQEISSLERKVGRRIPVWLMTSHATHDALVSALGPHRDAEFLDAFVQRLSVRLTPDGDVFWERDGEPSLHAPGHGDLPDALRSSGLLQRFVNGGGRCVTVANIDNLGASLDPAILGYHFRHGASATCEVVDKVTGDRGGIPVRLDDRVVVLEEFRLPAGFDASTVRVFSTNTFHVDARALLDSKIAWTYFTVRKEVGGRPAIQFERLLNELTSHLSTRYLRLPRDGVRSRFLPVKDLAELERRRAEIALVAADRSML